MGKISLLMDCVSNVGVQRRLNRSGRHSSPLEGRYSCRYRSHGDLWLQCRRPSTPLKLPSLASKRRPPCPSQKCVHHCQTRQAVIDWWISWQKTLGIVLGGGAGSRLYPLTKARAKPAVPLGGNYRLIDIPISNCLNSRINRIYVLTQFNSASLNRHVMSAYVRRGCEGEE